MEKIGIALEDALSFINTSPHDKDERDIWVERLTRNLLILDEYERSLDRKRLILATQTVIGQLEVLFDKKKPPILLFYEDISKRNCYSPSGESHDALGDAFDGR